MCWCKSWGLRIVDTIFLEWIELFELLCFIVLLKSVDIIPTEIVDAFGFTRPLPDPTPATWMVPEGCSAASIPFLWPYGEFIDCLWPTFFLMTPFCKGIAPRCPLFY